MRVLLDTCAFIWIDQRDFEKLGKKAWELIAGQSPVACVSSGSLWEIEIKRSRGLLAGTAPLEEIVSAHRQHGDLEILQISFSHLAQVERLPFHHKDPFDRLIIAQAMVEKIPVVSPDDKFDLYGVTRIWD